jgi:hypothetical protein
VWVAMHPRAMSRAAADHLRGLPGFEEDDRNSPSPRRSLRCESMAARPAAAGACASAGQGRDFHCSVDWDAAGAAWSLACAEATTVPVAGGGVAAPGDLGSCEILMGAPAGTKGAGALAVG